MVKTAKKPSNELTPIEAAKLENLELRIERCEETFRTIGGALLEIKDGKLYRAMHATFEEYAEQRWGYDRSYAYRLMKAAETAAALPIGDIQPTNESQVRPLAAVPEAERQGVWEKAAELAGEEGKPLAARHVKEAAARRTPEPEPVKEPPRPKGPNLDACNEAMVTVEEELMKASLPNVVRSAIETITDHIDRLSAKRGQR